MSRRQEPEHRQEQGTQKIDAPWRSAESYPSLGSNLMMIRRRLAIIEDERADSFSKFDAFQGAVRLEAIPPGDTDDKKLSQQL